MATARLDLSAFASGTSSFAGVSMTATSAGGTTTGSATASVITAASGGTAGSKAPIDGSDLIGSTEPDDDGDVGSSADPVLSENAAGDADDPNGVEDTGASNEAEGAGTVENAAAAAEGDPVVSTEITTLVYADGGDGDGASVETSTSGTAAGDDATSASAVQSYAVGGDEVDFALGLGYSAAAGEVYEEAEASTEPDGDIVISHDFASPEGEEPATAFSLGLAWDYV